MLGTYAFSGTGGEYIELSDLGGQTAADAVRLVEVTTAPPPTLTANLYYLHNDHLGTPQVITDQSQAIVWQADYQPFGTVSESVTILANNLRFAGQYFDSESGLHYNYFRDYDPSTGRYIQSDPIGLAGGLNTYGYVGGNPLISVDPLGLYHTSNGGTARCAYNDYDCAAGLVPDTPEKKEKRECVIKCVFIGEGTSAVRDKAIEKTLEAKYGGKAKIIWRKIQKLAGPISWAYSVYDCNKECDEECEI